jgi:hypothetical protein
MNRSTHPGLLILSLFCVAALAGCQSDYRYQSTLLPDGSIERALYQPLDDTPVAAKQEGVWKKTETVRDPSGKNYLKAEGKFASVKDLPNSLIIRGGDEEKLAILLPSSKLTHQYAKTDYVFVTEHRWTETVTDPVTFTSLRQGREELATLGIDIGQDVFNEVLGQWYDATELVKWLRSDGKAWLAELTDYAFVQLLAARNAKSPRLDDFPRDILEGLADICARYGLQFRENGKLIEDDKKLERVWEDFLVGLICQKVRDKKTGKPVSRETARAWLVELNGPKAKDPNPGANRFETAAKKVIKDKYGGEQAVAAKATLALIKVAGVYWSNPLHARNFDFTSAFPGEVVQTNGEILSRNRVRWRFTGFAAWPMGYVMNCRTLEAQSQVQKDLLGAQPLDNREAMLDFVTLVSQDRPGPSGVPPLLETVQRCRTQKSLTPLYDQRALFQKNNKKRLEQVNSLLRLLKLPVNGQGGGK